MQMMEELPRHRRSCFKRSATTFRSQSPTSSGQTAESEKKTNCKDKPPKNRRLLSFLFGIRSGKERRPIRTEEFHTSLEERDVRKLIRLYCKHDSLYNPRNAYYGNKEFDDDCYSDIARSIPGKSSSELRSCIEELRHLFEREYKIIKSARRSRGEVLIPSIRYYDEFLFLVPHLNKDLGESHAKSGASLLNPTSVIKPHSADLKNQLATKDLLCNKLTHFTGFPLAAFPGNISCSTKMFLRRMTRKPQKEQKKKNKEVSDPEEQLQKVTFTPSADHRLNEFPGNRNSKLSIASSYYSNEQDIKTTDLICPWRTDSSPCVSECSVKENESASSSEQQKSQKSMKSIPKSAATLVHQKFIKTSFKEPSETYQKAALEQQKSIKSSFKQPSETSQKATLEQQKSIKSSSKELSDTIQKAALEQQKSIKSSSKEPSEASQKTALEQQKSLKNSSKEPLETPQKTALEQQKSIKSSFKQPSEASQKAALEQQQSNKSGFKQPSEASQKGALEHQKSNKSSPKELSEASQMGCICQDNPSASNSREDRKEAPAEDKKDSSLATTNRNSQQVQMLCDMIRTELTSAPDFIYFDAKWRIIEILREVHKRQLVHMKAAPQENIRTHQLNQLMGQPNRNSLNPMPAKVGFSRLCNQIKGPHCPYCCRINNN